MFDKISTLCEQAENELYKRTSGKRSRFSVYAFLLYSAADLRTVSVINRDDFQKIIDSITGYDVLFVVVKPIEYETKELILNPFSAITFIDVPINAPAKLFEKLIGANQGWDSKLPAIVIVPQIPVLRSTCGNLLDSFRQETAMFITLDVNSEDEYRDRLGEILRRIQSAVNCQEENTNSDFNAIFNALKEEFREYQKFQIIRRTRKAFRGILEIVGLIPGL